MSIFAATCLHLRVRVDRAGNAQCISCEQDLPRSCAPQPPEPVPGGRVCGCRADPIVFGHDCRKEAAGG